MHHVHFDEASGTQSVTVDTGRRPCGVCVCVVSAIAIPHTGSHIGAYHHSQSSRIYADSGRCSACLVKGPTVGEIRTGNQRYFNAGAVEAAQSDP